jgi:hypothetical protein
VKVGPTFPARFVGDVDVARQPKLGPFRPPNLGFEWHGETPTVSGALYTQDYRWVIYVGPENRGIREVTGYYDTGRVNALFQGSGKI